MNTLSRRYSVAAGTLIAALVCLPAPAVRAFTSEERIDGVELRAYGPDWIWQRQDVNILLVCENRTDEPVSLSLEPVSPGEGESAFRHEGRSEASLLLPPGEVRRTAVTGLTARDDIPLGTYPVILTCRAGDRETILRYPVRIVRGGAVRPGVWAVLAPAFLAGLWGLLIILYLGRAGRRGAWRTPGEAAFAADNGPTDHAG